MKLSIVLSTQPASFSALAYKGHWEQNLAKIRDFGYDGVELAVRDPNLLDGPLLISLLAHHRLIVPAIGTGQAYGEEGLSLTDPDENIRRRAVERLATHVDLAAGLGAAVIIGLVRGTRRPELREELAEEWLLDALRECAARNPAVRLAVEPINRYETNLINTVASGLRLVERVGAENVGLLLDTFHMNIEEASIAASITCSGGKLFHFHIADSNRWHPGAGHTDFRAILGALDRISYQGFLSAEILPLPDPDTAALNNLKYMRALAA